MRVLLFGATGMVGQGVLRECLLDGRVTRVVSVARSRLDIPASLETHASKLSEILLPDLHDIAQVEEQLSGLDACFYCLGASSLGMSEADYTRVTYDLTMDVAAVLAPRNPGMTFIYVSAAGTRRDSRQMWARVRARTEEALASMLFKAAYILRPAFIQPLHGVVSKTGWYTAIYAVLRPLSPLVTKGFPAMATTTERMGQAMINLAAKGYSTQILDSSAINRASAMARPDRPT